MKRVRSLTVPYFLLIPCFTQRAGKALSFLHWGRSTLAVRSSPFLVDFINIPVHCERGEESNTLSTQFLRSESFVSLASLLKDSGYAGAEEEGEFSEQHANPTLSGRGLSMSDMQNYEGKAAAELLPIQAVPGAAMIKWKKQGYKGGDNDGDAAVVGGLPANRYLVPLTPPFDTSGPESSSSRASHVEDEALAKQRPLYVMVDVPPYSDELAQDIRSFVSNAGGSSNNLEQERKRKGSSDQHITSNEPVAIVITNRNSVHYDEAPGVYSSPRSDLRKWKDAFPGTEIVIHRLDVMRDLKVLVTQELEGYGPWALDEETYKFVETGKKLVVLDWDNDKIMKIYGREGIDPDKATADALKEAGLDDDDDGGGKVDVRSNEEGKSLLAIYTPGHTMGSICFVLPKMQVCCSGNTIPEYRARPRLDDEGLLSTNRAGLYRQVKSGLDIADHYSDRFRYVFPSKGDVMVVEGNNSGERRGYISEIVKQFEKAAKLYANMGIFHP